MWGGQGIHQTRKHRLHSEPWDGTGDSSQGLKDTGKWQSPDWNQESPSPAQAHLPRPLKAQWFSLRSMLGTALDPAPNS